LGTGFTFANGKINAAATLPTDPTFNSVTINGQGHLNFGTSSNYLYLNSNYDLELMLGPGLTMSFGVRKVTIPTGTTVSLWDKDLFGYGSADHTQWADNQLVTAGQVKSVIQGLVSRIDALEAQMAA
jgi:hypothetical protein